MFIKGVILFFVSLSAFSSWGTRYSRNDHLICEDFEDMEESYKRRPESVHLQVGYGICLIAKGYDFEGLKFWHDAADIHNSVHAAYLIAKYIQTKGTFDFKKPDWDKLDEIIKAYLRVLLYINVTPDYPFGGLGYALYEDEAQMEIKSRFRVPHLYYNKFIRGLKKSENDKLLTSLSYKGERDLGFANDYDDHTTNSLRSAIEYGEECANLPMKGHFKPDDYSRYTTACRIISDLARDLLPLEQKRRHILQQESCSKDLPQCAEYYEHRKKMEAIASSKMKELRKTGI